MQATRLVAGCLPPMSTCPRPSVCGLLGQAQVQGDRDNVDPIFSSTPYEFMADKHPLRLINTVDGQIPAPPKKPWFLFLFVCKFQHNVIMVSTMVSECVRFMDVVTIHRGQHDQFDLELSLSLSLSFRQGSRPFWLVLKGDNHRLPPFLAACRGGGGGL